MSRHLHFRKAAKEARETERPCPSMDDTSQPSDSVKLHPISKNCEAQSVEAQLVVSARTELCGVVMPLSGAPQAKAVKMVPTQKCQQA